MPRAARDSLGGFCYHVMNRGNARRVVFRKQGDYDAFINLLAQAGERVDVRLRRKNGTQLDSGAAARCLSAYLSSSNSQLPSPYSPLPTRLR
jgi:hypothetical protein